LLTLNSLKKVKGGGGEGEKSRGGEKKRLTSKGDEGKEEGGEGRSNLTVNAVPREPSKQREEKKPQKKKKNPVPRPKKKKKRRNARKGGKRIHRSQC